MSVARLRIATRGQGLHEITRDVEDAVAKNGIEEGLATVFVRHTSASLVIQENADPSAARDLEAWLDRLVPEHDRLYTHLSEGPDDVPSHIKAALTATSLGIPILGGRLALGTWAGRLPLGTPPPRQHARGDRTRRRVAVEGHGTDPA